MQMRRHSREAAFPVKYVLLRHRSLGKEFAKSFLATVTTTTVNVVFLALACFPVSQIATEPWPK